VLAPGTDAGGARRLAERLASLGLRDHRHLGGRRPVGCTRSGPLRVRGRGQRRLCADRARRPLGAGPPPPSGPAGQTPAGGCGASDEGTSPAPPRLRRRRARSAHSRRWPRPRTRKRNPNGCSRRGAGRRGDGGRGDRAGEALGESARAARIRAGREHRELGRAEAPDHVRQPSRRFDRLHISPEARPACCWAATGSGGSMSSAITTQASAPCSRNACDPKFARAAGKPLPVVESGHGIEQPFASGPVGVKLGVNVRTDLEEDLIRVVRRRDALPRAGAQRGQPPARGWPHRGSSRESGCCSKRADRRGASGTTRRPHVGSSASTRITSGSVVRARSRHAGRALLEDGVSAALEQAPEPSASLPGRRPPGSTSGNPPCGIRSVMRPFRPTACA